MTEIAEVYKKNYVELESVGSTVNTRPISPELNRILASLTDNVALNYQSVFGAYELVSKIKYIEFPLNPAEKKDPMHDDVCSNIWSQIEQLSVINGKLVTLVSHLESLVGN